VVAKDPPGPGGGWAPASQPKQRSRTGVTAARRAFQEQCGRHRTSKQHGTDRHGCLCRTHHPAEAARHRRPSAQDKALKQEGSPSPREGRHAEAVGLHEAHASPAAWHQSQAPVDKAPYRRGAAIISPTTQTPERITQTWASPAGRPREPAACRRTQDQNGPRGL